MICGTVMVSTELQQVVADFPLYFCTEAVYLYLYIKIFKA